MRREEKAATGAIFALLVLASGALQTVSEISGGWLRWVLLILASVLAGLIPFTPSWVEIRRRLARIRAVRWRYWLGWLTVWTLAAVGTVTLGAVAVPVVTAAAEGAWIRQFGCPKATQLTLVAAPEDLFTARQLADAFELETARSRSGCPTVDIYAYAEMQAVVTEAALRGWTADDVKSLGPRPDLWLLASPERLGADSLRGLADTAVIGSSPVVLAVPPSLLIDPRLDDSRRGLTWRQLLDRAHQLQWKVSRPDPGLSAAAELATVAIYRSDSKPADPARARQLERELPPEGLPLADGNGLLCARPAAALIVTEQQMARYNDGLGLGCARPGASERLRAFYPTDSHALVIGMTRLTWPDAADDQVQWGAEFIAWLGREKGRQALIDSALRPAQGWSMRDPLSERNGVLPQAYGHEQPEPAEFDEVARTRANAQRPARILLALDASQSMGQRIGANGSTPFDLAKRGIAGALRHIGPGDEFALWSFQGRGGPTRLTEFGPHSAGVQDRLATVTPSGSTPLYATIVEGVNELAPSNPDRVTALVVLTDGVYEPSEGNTRALLDSVRDRDVAVFVVATGRSSCAEPALAEVAKQTEGGCFDVDAEILDRRLSDLFTILWKRS